MSAGGTRATFIPERGDLIWLDFDPQAGHEQRGRRPALVVSPRKYNAASGLALCCPITGQMKGYPFEVRLPAQGAVSGVVLSDQIKSIDWQARRAERAGRVSVDLLGEVVERLRVLIG